MQLTFTLYPFFFFSLFIDHHWTLSSIRHNINCKFFFRIWTHKNPPKIEYFQEFGVTPSPVSTVTVTKSERKMSSFAPIELHKSFEGAETGTEVPAADQPQPSTPTVTAPTTPPTSSSLSEAAVVGELKAVHDIPSTPPVGKTKESASAKSAPSKPAKK